ncbi:phage baseplate assembly protein V [uncultured Aquimarina sp.]|uniref:type VI secretion system Vgr family protein n=1 Tax=uncultured Aquimarina sp. TaxID=575652 RepID=UPI0026396793|nr:phage baseplate assembly protein V [uncultured Aquimarina sp.]
MALQSKLDIYIGGTPITSFKTFSLRQKITEHHDFELVCRTDVLEQLSGEMVSQTKNFLGESFIVQIKALGFMGGYKELAFKGIVTAVNSTKGFQNSTGDSVVISGKSSSIIADDGPHYASHNDVPLSDILQKTFQGYDTSMLSLAFDPTKTDSLHYSVQQNESSYEYATRLAAQYSEWFYYNGSALVFGKTEYDTIPLSYGIDLQEFSLKLAPKPNKYKYFTNDYLTDEQHEKSTTEVDAGVNGFNQFTNDKSETIFAKETAVYINSYNDAKLKQRLDTHVIQQKKASVVNQVIVKGKSDNPGVNLGDVVTIQDDTTGYGSFRIIKVTHSASENGKYQNEFEGITAELDVYPNTDMMAFPKSETQIATVMENVDPDGLSRIRVQFPWQKPYGELTPWLRVVSPHAGGEKGFHFIPEKGEEVLIGFEGGNAERPYVMGSLYTGAAQPGAFQSDANDIKAIQSRSGTKLVLDDKAGSLLLTDQGTASMMMDGGGNTRIATDASHTTTVGEDSSILKMDKDGNIDITGKEKLTITIGDSSITMLKDGTIKLKGKAITTEGDDIGVGAHNSIAIFSKSNHIAGNTKMDGGDVFIN